MVAGERMPTAGAMAPVRQQMFQNIAWHAVLSQKPIDLSCHEMDVDCGSTLVDHCQSIDDDMADSQGTLKCLNLQNCIHYQRILNFICLMFPACLQCFDTVGWASGRASGP